MNLKAIVFDFDGVVVNSEPLYERAEGQLFKEYNVTVPEEDWKHFKGISEAGFYRKVQQDYNIQTDIKILLQRGRELLLQEFRNGLSYMPGFVDFFRSVNTHYKVGLVTSTSYAVLGWIFENTEIENFFKHIVTADDVRCKKPNPDPYLQICHKLGVKPTETLAIEDSIHGVSSARRAGVVTIGFTSSLSSADLAHADYRANSFKEISAILAELSN